MNIYGINGQPIISNIKLNANCKHEEEMMKSNFVKLSFRHSIRKDLPIGAYVEVDGVKYILLDPYSPKQETENKFLYEPEFQHPIMWLGKIPFIHKQGDTTTWETTIKKFSWTYTGAPATLANEMARYINWLSSVYPAFAAAIGEGWTARTSDNLSPSETFTFDSVDILSAAAEMANVCECEYHFDYEKKVFHFGDIAYLREGSERPVLKSGDNVGVASVSQSKEAFYNCFIVKGGTRNISQQAPSGDNVQVTERLSLDETKYPDSVIDIRGGEDEPKLFKELLFDDIYPKMELYLYNPRERKCYLLDDNGEKVVDETDPTGYKTYSKWYIRLAYQKDDVWHDYLIDPEKDLIKDKPLSLAFQPNYNSTTYTSPLIGREFELVYFDKQTVEKEDDDVNPDGFTAQPGDYRIIFLEGDIIIPSTSRQGLYPKGDVVPSTENNIVTLFNIVVDEVYKDIAREELEAAGLRSIERLQSDLNTYTLNTNPVKYEDILPTFHLGEAVTYDDGQDLNGGTSYRLNTHIRKLVTRLDHPECVEISIGNEQIKGSVTSLREKVDELSGGLIGGLTEAQFDELLMIYGSQHFLSKEFNDVANGVITFLKGARYGVYQKGEKGASINGFGDAEFRKLVVRLSAIVRDLTTGHFEEGLTDSGAFIDQKGNAEFEKIVTRALATLQALFVKGDSAFNGNLSSTDFVSGFPGGYGWALQKKEYINAAGQVEYKYVLECDSANIRGSLRVYEMIISQLLGENDNRIFTAMLEVHHYDPATGKVWLKTGGGKMYNPFRKGDCIMVQQYQPGGSVQQGGDGYLVKDYELRITDVGSGGAVDEDGNRLDWVTFSGFASQMTGATPETLIKEDDTFCRVDNLTDPERKGIIQMVTVGTNAPYMDIFYGMKTNPDEAHKGRIGNLQGIQHHLFGWLQDFGEYLINAYIVGDVRLKRTGESLDTAVEIVKGLLATSMAETIYEITDDNNYLRNASFIELTNTGAFRDWTVSGDDIKFYTIDSDPVISSVGTLADVKSCVKTEKIDGKQVLHIVNGSVKQAKSVIKVPGTHKEYDEGEGDEQTDTYTTVRDTLYLGIRIRVVQPGTLTIGFPDSVMEDQNAMKGKTMVLERSNEWKTLQWSGTWDGNSDFLMKFTGECYISLLSLTDSPLSEFKTEYSTQIKQTTRNISLIATRTSSNESSIAQLIITADNISSTVENYKEDLDGKISANTSLIEQTATQIRTEVKSTTDDLDERVTANASSITQTAEAIRSEVESSVTTLDGKISANTSLIQQTADSISSAVASGVTEANGYTDDEIAAAKVVAQGYVDTLKGLINSDVLSDGTNGYATFKQQTQDDISAIAGKWDSDGNLIGYSTTQQTADSISSAVANRVTEAAMELYVDDAISHISFRADDIDFHFTKNTSFYANGTEVMNLNTDGDLWIKGDIKANSSFSGGTYYLSNDVNFYINGTKFANFGSTASGMEAMLALRHDGGTCLSIGSYDSGIGVSITANTNATAIKAYGKENFYVRSDEYFEIQSYGTGTGYFAPGCAVKNKSFTLPSSPKNGTIFFLHGAQSANGVTQDLTVTTKGHPIMESDGRGNLVNANSSYNFNDDSVILVFFDAISKWVLFKAW